MFGRIPLLPALRAALARWDAGREAGGASVEFVIVFPVFMVVFFSGFEAAMLTTRQVMLERSLDLTARELRLTTGADWTHGDIVRRVCRNARILTDCNTRLVLEMTEIDRSTYDLPAADQPCVNTRTNVTPLTTWDNDKEQEMTLLRACYAIEPMLPGVGLGLVLIEGTDDDGDGTPDRDTVQMMAATAFVREPEIVAAAPPSS